MHVFHRHTLNGDILFQFYDETEEKTEDKTLYEWLETV